MDDVIAAIQLSRFHGRSITEFCAMGGITLDDFTSGVAYREIFGCGLEEGQQKGRLEGRQVEAAAMALRQLQRRCGPLPSDQQQRIQALSAAGLRPADHTQQLPGELGTGDGAATQRNGSALVKQAAHSAQRDSFP
jgi:predicted transposase YdaD